MGGKAFSGILPPTSFPRLPPPIYHALKARLTPVLERLYHYVGTPHEAPEKLDHGDLDFTVALPRITTDEDKIAVPYQTCKEALGAAYVVPMPGNRTSNYAVPMKRSEWEMHGLSSTFDKLTKDNESQGLFYQVDVHPATDDAEARRVVFFNSYGDLGMIMGLIAAINGLKLTPHGLKMLNGKLPPVLLSDNMDEIMKFLDLNLIIRERGFQTRHQIFEWIGASRLFNPRQFRWKGDGIHKVKEERTMYSGFCEWADGQKSQNSTETSDEEDWEALKMKRREEALRYFGKKESFDEEMRLIKLRTNAKNIFNGTKVHEWSNSGNDWEMTRTVLHVAKRNMGGEEGVWDVIEREGEDGVKHAVLAAIPEAISELQATRAARQSHTGELQEATKPQVDLS